MAILDVLTLSMVHTYELPPHPSLFLKGKEILRKAKVVDYIYCLEMLSV